MTLIELRDYGHAPTGRGKGLQTFSFRLEEGDVYRLTADRVDDGHLFLRALATLEPPESGTYLYKEQVLRFTDRRQLLAVRRHIGYLGADAALVGNRTLRTNLLLGRYYYENRLSLELSDEVMELCRIFGIDDKLDLRPAQVAREDARAAVIIRELTKGAEVYLMEQAFVYIAQPLMEKYRALLRTAVQAGIPCVFYGDFQSVDSEIPVKTIDIRDGQISFG